MSGGFGELQDLYGEVILDHNRRPRNFGRLPGASHSAVGYNPLCGDRVEVYLRVEQGRIEEIAFEGVGCAISTASASMMTEALRGKSLEETRRLFASFHALVTGAPAGGGSTRAGFGGEARAEAAGSSAAGGALELGKLAAFAGVGEYPMRVKCATLAWHALQSALQSGAAAAPSEPESPPGSKETS
ncbi:MAG TPA: SUF system NifU family Fe-S cluster assembly protein [Thermoanaerobaculia bacterium]|nr:SUF system NifU family Fe-S cluster assembly protein [Thermoanaerobaculia bacterium]